MIVRRGFLILMSISIVLLSAPLFSSANGYKPIKYHDPRAIQSEVSSQGVNEVVKELFENKKTWKFIMNKIASGNADWLQVAALLYPGTEARARETLHHALGEALVPKPANVLRLVPKGIRVDNICSWPDVDDPRYKSYELSSKEIERRTRSLRSVSENALKKSRNECLESLDVAKKVLAAVFETHNR